MIRNSTPQASRGRSRRASYVAVAFALLSGACNLGVSQSGSNAGPQAPSAPGGGAQGPGEWKPARENAWGEEQKARTPENLFVTLLGKSEAEVDEKLESAVHRFFGIGTNEPATPVLMEGYRVYYELPQDTNQAFIWAADSNDVRSEGMSYGMMIAVQMDMREQFDKLWRFAKAHMQYPENTDTPAWRYYFRWQGKVDTSAPQNWKVNFGSQTVPAPDGEEYFAAALYLADRKWGSSGEIDYRAEAGKVSWAMLNNSSVGGRFPIIHREQNMVVFVPYGSSNDHSDPSYHLPGFYEMFAEYGPAGDAERWRKVAEVSREYLVKSAHPTTGLHPDYADFAGKPTQGYQSSKHDQFQYDAWRTPLNMALDHAWFGDARMKAQVEKYHAFFSQHLDTHNVSSALFRVDGSDPSGGGSTALTATLAAGAHASGAANAKQFVENLWHIQQQQGQWRYYQECVYLLGMLATAGRFHYDFPPPAGG